MKFFAHIGTNIRRRYENRTEPEAMRHLAEDYWHALICILLIGAIAIVLYGLAQFSFVIAAPQQQSSTFTPRTLPLDRVELQSVLEALSERAAAVAAGIPAAPIPNPAVAK